MNTSSDKTEIAKSRLIGNFVLFQIGWFSCVTAGATDWHWFGSLGVLLIVIYHLQAARDTKSELILVLSAVAIGVLWESAMVSSGLMKYRHGLLSTFLAPHWIIAIWALFATTINVSMGWLKNRLPLASLLGAICGPMSFYTGKRLGAVEFPDLPVAMVTLALGWAVMMPALMWLANRFDGVSGLTQEESSKLRVKA